LSCEIRFNKDRTKAWLGQPHLIKAMENKFKEEVEMLTVYKTPGTPGQGIVRPKSDKEKVGPELQSRYRTGTGMLLWLVKHSRPDIDNAVRELTKCNDGAHQAAYKELLRSIKFVLDTKDFGLKLEPMAEVDGEWFMQMFVDSDHAGDKESRISVTGYILYLMGVPILWKSKGQRSVALSSSEAEYVALSEAAKEIKFVYMILKSMGIKVKTPIRVRVDNMGAIYMSGYNVSSNRTKHIDVRYHFVREYVEDGFIEIIFVTTENNDADGFTKNVDGSTYDRHAVKYVADKSFLK